MPIYNPLFEYMPSKNGRIIALDAKEFKAQITNKKVQLIDLRTSNEFNSGHLENAINIDYFSDEFYTEFNKLNKAQAIYLYCRSGVRSKQGANKLAAINFMKIYDLKGGLLYY